jgi:hypothetical protein
MTEIERRSAPESLHETDGADGRAARGAWENTLARFAASDDPVHAYKARLLTGLAEGSEEERALRARIAASPMARALLSGREPDGTIRTHPYKKWQGPHWTLQSLALIDYPPGDTSLMPLMNQVYRWLLARQLPGRRTPPGQDSRARFCASMEGNAIWYSIRLGLADERTDRLARTLIRWQWPDGGWNCDDRAKAATSSFQETAIPVRALWAFGKRYADGPAFEAVAGAAELLLSRRLLWRRRDGALIDPDWGGHVDLIHFPIQFYDVLFALQVMAESGRIGDERCADALRLLESKQLTDGGFPLEAANATRADHIASRGSFAGWGPTGTRRGNPLVSLAAWRVLDARRQASSAATS